MNVTIQRWFVWSGPALITIFLVGFWFVGGLVPPPSPALGAEEIAHFYAENQTRIQIGLLISMIAAGLAFPWAVVIALQMRRIEDRWGPLAVTELVSGAVLCLLFVFPMFAMAAAAYRPESRPPEITQALNDLGWLPFIGFIAPACVQVLTIGIAPFVDRRATPVFPRWVGYFNLWCVVLFAPGILDIFFKTGPFAWNGVFAFWIVLAIFGSWFLVMVPPLLSAIRQQEAEEISARHAVTDLDPV